MKTTTRPTVSAKLRKLKVVNAAHPNLVPTRNIPEAATFRITGINNAIANALRRTAALELPVKAMSFAADDFTTDDPFIMVDMIFDRIRLVPIDQATPNDATWSLSVTNRSAALIEVRTVDFTGRAHPFNNFVLCKLQPGRSIMIKKITVEYGIGRDFAGFSVAHQARAPAVDQQPINTFEPSADGLPASMSNPTVYDVAFCTNGTMAPDRIMAESCNNIAGRLAEYKEFIPQMETTGDFSTLTVPGSGDTIGNLLMRAILVIEPDIPAVTYAVDPMAQRMTLKLRGPTDPIAIASLVAAAADSLIEQFTQLGGMF